MKESSCNISLVISEKEKFSVSQIPEQLNDGES
jgi:hypothetical protein